VYWKVGKAVEDDPEYDTRRAKRAIARWAALHPHNLAQKAELIVEHFREHTAQKIGGKAKAMVVTSSRLHAVRYKQALDRYITTMGALSISICATLISAPTLPSLVLASASRLPVRAPD
jgi:type I restriction enzyme R subunit